MAQPTVLICGAGVIGAATAQALATRGAPVTVVDRVGVAAAASGRAGGFLALDWNDRTPVGPLARRSFELHRELASGVAVECGYRPLETVASFGAHGQPLDAPHNPASASWLDRDVVAHGVLGTPGTTAVVHPRRLTEALLADAGTNGARVLRGVVQSVDRDGPAGATRGAVVDGELIRADVVVVALGPWSARLGLPIPAVGGLKGASIVLRADAPPQAVFGDYVTASGARMAPELYAREGEVYVCGVPSAAHLPDSPEQVTVDEDDCDLLRDMAAGHSSLLASAEVIARQGCFRPVTADGVPLIGPVPGVPGAYVATGHGPWGILNAPATGEMLAEMILDGAARTVDAGPFSVARQTG